MLKMRRSNKCGSVRNDIINLHFGSSAGPSVSIPAFCKIPATFIGSIRPNNQPGKTKEPKNEIELPANCIILPWPIYSEPGAKRGNQHPETGKKHPEESKS